MYTVGTIRSLNRLFSKIGSRDISVLRNPLKCRFSGKPKKEIEKISTDRSFIFFPWT